MSKLISGNLVSSAASLLNKKSQNCFDSPFNLDGNQMFRLPEEKSWKKATILISEIMDYRSFTFYGPKHALGHKTEAK